MKKTLIKSKNYLSISILCELDCFSIKDNLPWFITLLFERNGGATFSQSKSICFERKTSFARSFPLRLEGGHFLLGLCPFI